MTICVWGRPAHPTVQIADLEASINAVPCDTVVIATPMDLRRVIKIEHPATVVSSNRSNRSNRSHGAARCCSDLSRQCSLLGWMEL